ncbi:MAG: hypothetical protein PVI91_10020 [Gammaproteobacteria bacterium]|jgi:hypothetical protein
MAAKVVVVGSALLPTGVEFPPLGASRNGWEEYPSLRREDVVDRCWRADVVVLLSGDSGIDRAMPESLLRLKLVMGVGEVCARLDRDTLVEHGVELLELDALARGRGDAQDLCNCIARAIDDYLLRIDAGGRAP